MTTEEILERLATEYDDEPLLLADGFEAALLGTVVGCARPTVACYDYDKCIEILMARDGMDEQEAKEFFEFNVAGAFVGERTPLFLHNLRGLDSLT